MIAAIYADIVDPLTPGTPLGYGQTRPLFGHSGSGYSHFSPVLTGR